MPTATDPQIDSQQTELVRQVAGLMQDAPLLISSLIEHADRYHGRREVVSRLPELDPTAPLHRTNYTEIHARSKRLANALSKEMGVAKGTVVGTLAFNTFRHIESFYGVCGMGAILHTANPRLLIEPLEYTLDHAEDHVLLVDAACVPVLVQLVERKHIKCRNFIIMTSEEHMPKDPQLAQQNNSAGVRVWCYETLLARHSPQFEWPVFDETTASSLCYTSGTTGNPKGVLSSHRSTLLSTFVICTQDVLGISSHDCILALVPLFHANAWGIPYAACMAGAKLVLPGPAVGGASIVEHIQRERVTFALGVPTVFIGLLEYMDKHRITSLGTLERILMGGATPSRALVRRFMCDLKLASFGTCTGIFLPQHQHLSLDEKVTLTCKQGRVMSGVKLKLVDDQGRELPHDGKSAGHLLVAGPWVLSAYYRDVKSPLDAAGYFDTGDVATLDSDGYLSLTDRSKDVIKSGGEWISSIALENEAMEHPQVAEAAVIGLPHPKYTERPLLIVRKKEEGLMLTAAQLLTWLSKRVAKWSLPDAVEFVAEIPHAATGKIKKMDLRKQFADYVWPAVHITSKL